MISSEKKSALVAVALALTLLLSGCSSVFDKDYLSVKKASEQAETGSSESGFEVKNYLELKLFLTRLVVEHSERGKLNFKNYKGKAKEDLAAVCRDVSAKMALGVYCVDYISYDIAYYGASVNINYKKTKEETDAIKSVNTAGVGLKLIEEAMHNGEKLLILHIRNSKLTEEDIRSFIEKKYLEAPLEFPLRPGVLVGTYGSGDISKIFELRLDYGAQNAERLKISERCSEEIKRITDSIGGKSEAFTAMELINALRENVELDEKADGSLRSAAVAKLTSGEGFSVLLKACCDELGIESVVVRGRLKSDEQLWNILKLDGEYYHFDIARYKKSGHSAFVFAGDEKMKGEYFWDFEEYPACRSKLQYENFSS